MSRHRTLGSAPMLPIRLLLLGVFCFLAPGCRLFGGLEIEPVAVSSSRSAQVAVFASVTDSGEGVKGLAESNFDVEEDGIPLDRQQIKLQLLPRDGVVEHHLLVLVDLSGPVEAPGTRSLLARQVSEFVGRVTTYYSVSLYGFDGSEKLTPLGTFRKQANPTAPGLDRLASVPQKDPSSNLHGAMVTGLNQLTATLAASSAPIGLGSMLVIARGPDLAGRTSHDSVLEAINDSPHRVLALTAGTWADPDEAEALGPHGHETAARFEIIEAPLSELARALEEDYARYYLLSYCSPARAGSRSLLVRVRHHDDEGKPTEAQAYSEFDASGFTGRCNPSAPPRFSRMRTGGRVTTSSAGATKGAAASESAAGPDSTDSSAPDQAPAVEEEPIAPPPNSNYAQ